MDRSMKTKVALVGAVCAVAAGIVVVSVAGAGGKGGDSVEFALRDASGVERGSVTFKTSDAHTEVRVRLDSTGEEVARDAFHGFHIHANDDPDNGEGCVADPAAQPKTWFTAVDGHWKSEGQGHGSHLGDMPSVLLTSDGSADQRFLTDRIDLDQLEGKAVVLHAGPDNFGNVPTGTASNQYSPNTPEATTATAATGNSGDRVLCGVAG